MKKIFTIICFVAFCNLLFYAQSGWSELSSGTSNDLKSVYFTDINNGYVVGDFYGTILKTIDGGNSWTAPSSGTTYRLWSVYFTDTNTGYAVGDYGTIIKTTNAGLNWTLLTSGIVNDLRSVYFTDVNNGYAVGYGGKILKTSNAGTDWTLQTSGTNLYLWSVYFTNAVTGYAIGQNGKILKTTNAGNNWIAQTSGTGNGLYSVYFTDENTGYIVGENLILKTINAGFNWIAQVSVSFSSLISVNFTDTITGYAVGDQEGIFKTTNAGMNWVEQISGTNNCLWSVYFLNASIGYAVGDNGIFLKTTTGGGIPPVITAQPVSKNICIGQNIYFSISAYGSPIYYKWQHNGIDIPNSNNDTLFIVNANLVDTGNYRCVVWNDLSSDTSNLVHLSVIILSNNTSFNSTICNGQGTQLTTMCNSNYPIVSGTLNYWWYPSTGLSALNVSNPIASPIINTNYTVMVSDQLGCSRTDQLNVIVQNVVQNEQICLVSVDPILNKNKIVWEKTANVGTRGFNIFKEVALNVYNNIGLVSFDSTSSYIDFASNPLAHGDKYKITAIDTCENESAKSYFHKTMNLTVAINGSTMGLNWDDYIDESGQFVPDKFYIYRDTSSSNLSLYDSISSSFHSYNDYNVYNSYYYRIGVKKMSSCNLSKNITNIAFSNIKQNFSNGIDIIRSKYYLRIYPNPSDGKFTLEFANPNKNNVAIIITDITGKPVLETTSSQEKYEFNSKELQIGIYIVKVLGDQIYYRKIVVE